MCCKFRAHRPHQTTRWHCCCCCCCRRCRSRYVCMFVFMFVCMYVCMELCIFAAAAAAADAAALCLCMCMYVRTYFRAGFFGGFVIRKSPLQEVSYILGLFCRKCTLYSMAGFFCGSSRIVAQFQTCVYMAKVAVEHAESHMQVEASFV